jgi:hypothetical protein
LGDEDLEGAVALERVALDPADHHVLLCRVKRVEPKQDACAELVEQLGKIMSTFDTFGAKISASELVVADHMALGENRGCYVLRLQEAQKLGKTGGLKRLARAEELDASEPKSLALDDHFADLIEGQIIAPQICSILVSKAVGTVQSASAAEVDVEHQELASFLLDNRSWETSPPSYFIEIARGELVAEDDRYIWLSSHGYHRFFAMCSMAAEAGPS